MTYTEPGQAYSNASIDRILGSVNTIAMVGASADPQKPSYGVLQVLLEAGYDVIPVNPRPGLTEIAGRPVYPSLHSIDRPVDMVDVFRPSAEFPRVARDAVAIGAKVLWAQLDIYDDEAARIAEAGGLTVVMDRCPKLELFRASREANANHKSTAINEGGSSLFYSAFGYIRTGGPLNTTC